MIKLIENGVRIYPDGREVCLLDTAAGKREYDRRRTDAWYRQQGTCAGECDMYVPPGEATLDHITPRGMGGSTRDDRQENLQMMCSFCNSAKGSKRTCPRFFTDVRSADAIRQKTGSP